MKLNLIHERPIIAEHPLSREFREMMGEMGIKIHSKNDKQF